MCFTIFKHFLHLKDEIFISDIYHIQQLFCIIWNLFAIKHIKSGNTVSLQYFLLVKTLPQMVQTTLILKNM